jgi:hypothetical protein
MSAKSWMIDKVRRAVRPTTGAHHGSAANCAGASTAGANGELPTFAGMQVWPGTPYQQVLIPIEYPPSRDYAPRWGYGKPSHQGLSRLFAQRTPEYQQVLSELYALRPWLSKISPRFTNESAPNPGWIGGPITPLDCALNYYFVQKYRPETYLEIGSGVTTCFARRAVQDHKLSTRIISIDPEPRASIDAICDEVIRYGMETVDLAMFERLKPGDIVFMDGSHRTFMNSDVTVFMLEVLPLLKPGVIVHIHDILLPNDYPDDFKHWYWNEQYMVGVYLLAAGPRVQVLMPSNFVSITPELNECLKTPLVELGAQNEAWRYGGSLWFTHAG